MLDVTCELYTSRGLSKKMFFLGIILNSSIILNCLLIFVLYNFNIVVDRLQWNRPTLTPPASSLTSIISDIKPRVAVHSFTPHIIQ